MAEELVYNSIHTGVEIDEGISKTKQIVNPNLLDNWYFVNPVNQRGQTEYSNDTYTIDRWKNAYVNNIVTVEDGGVRWAWGRSVGAGSSFFRQPFERTLPAGTYTISALVLETVGTPSLYVGQGGTPVGGQVVLTTGLVFNTFTVQENVAADRVQISLPEGSNVKLAAIKLELGSQQTLARKDENGEWVLNEIPDYGEQLLKCQRYYQLFSSADARPSDLADYRPSMQANPAIGTIDVGGKTYYFADANL